MIISRSAGLLHPDFDIVGSQSAVLVLGRIERRRDDAGQFPGQLGKHILENPPRLVLNNYERHGRPFLLMNPAETIPPLTGIDKISGHVIIGS